MAFTLSASVASATKMQKFVGFKAAALPAAPRAAKMVAPARQQRMVIRAARVGGVEIPNQKRVECALTYIFGIGPVTAKAILAETGVENKRTRDLTEDELTTLRTEVDKYQTEGDLRRFNLLSIKRLKEIQCYRGKRHIQGLPMRGQGTKNNARTRKGKRIAIAGKKKVAKK